MSRILVIIAVAHAAMAQVPFLGNCPNLGTMRDFNFDKVSIQKEFIDEHRRNYSIVNTFVST